MICYPIPMASSNRRAQLLRTIGNAFLELSDLEEQAAAEGRPAPPDNSKLLTVSEAAKRLSIGRTTLYHLMNDGVIPFVKVGNDRRVEPWAVDHYIQHVRRISSSMPVPVTPIEPRRPGRPRESNTNASQLLSVRGAAQRLSVSIWTVYAILKRGDLDYKLVNGVRRIDVRELERYIDAGRAPQHASTQSSLPPLTPRPRRTK